MSFAFLARGKWRAVHFTEPQNPHSAALVTEQIGFVTMRPLLTKEETGRQN